MRSLICTVCLICQCIEGMALWGRFSVAPSSYTKLVRAVYRQRMYLHLVQFPGMLHCWLQRYHTRIRALGSSLVDLVCIYQYARKNKQQHKNTFLFRANTYIYSSSILEIKIIYDFFFSLTVKTLPHDLVSMVGQP